MKLKEYTITLYKYPLASEEVYWHHVARLLLHEGERLAVGDFLFERTKKGIEEIHVSAMKQGN